MAHDDILSGGLELAMNILEEEKRLVYKKAYDKGRKKACDKGYGGNYAVLYAEGYEKGYELFKTEYRKCIVELMDAMFEDGRRDEFIAALCDKEKEDRLFREYGINPYWLQ